MSGRPRLVVLGLQAEVRHRHRGLRTQKGGTHWRQRTRDKIVDHGGVMCTRGSSRDFESRGSITLTRDGGPYSRVIHHFARQKKKGAAPRLPPTNMKTDTERRRLDFSRISSFFAIGELRAEVWGSASFLLESTIEGVAP